MADETVAMTSEMTPQGDSLPPDDIVVVSEEDAAKSPTSAIRRPTGGTSIRRPATATAHPW